MQFRAPSFQLIQAGTASWIWRLLRSATVATYENGGLGTAKGVAYSGLLAFFPVLTTLAAVLVQARADDVARTIAALLYDVVPPGTEDVVRTLFVDHGSRPKYLLIVATLLSAWAASGAILSLMEAFRAVYHIPSGRGLWTDRGVAILLVFATAIPILGGSAAIVFGTRAEQTLMSWVGLMPEGAEFRGWVQLGGKALQLGLAFVTFVLVATLIFYFSPNRRQRLRYVFPGAVLATVLWMLATIVVGWWIRNIANYNVLYGSVGAGLALVVWMYVLAVVAVLGCEFNAARERLLRGPASDL
ncbi:MAG TPA: YihY/virulence factor BrkB family protein [Bryobacteraceae bacterium]|jgi:membrane protein|nr:YihY/virulence factor BrkB family protein [Bryobacteraceae bacterium]